MRSILLNEVAPQPWRNGRGRTRELLAWPAGADRWQVRVSVADIDDDAPFSAFPGVERWFAVIDGAGVELTIDGTAHRVGRDSAPLRFDGAADVRCRLLDGPTRDLNLMLRGGAGGALRVLRDGQTWRPGAAQCGVFSACAARCDIADMAPMSLLWFDTAPPSLVVRAAQSAPFAALGITFTAKDAS